MVTMGGTKESLCVAWTHIFPITLERENKELGIGPPNMGSNTKSLMEIPHRHATDHRSGSGGVKQAQVAISASLLGRIGLANIGEKSNRFQGNSFNTHGEFSHVETIPSTQDGKELRSPGLLQRGSEGDTELLDSVEAKLGSIQRSPAKDGMEHDSNINNGD